MLLYKPDSADVSVPSFAMPEDEFFVDVQQEDIAKGLGSATGCPIARAVARATGCHAAVNDRKAVVIPRDGDTQTYSHTGGNFVQRFDRNLPVLPTRIYFKREYSEPLNG
jgi:hypothetical protein